MSAAVAMSSAQADQPPKSVVLFSGHMIDAPGRKTPRFPPQKEGLAADAIAGMLAKIAVTERDLAICGGSCGGDLLFAEACLAQGMEGMVPPWYCAAVWYDRDGVAPRSVHIGDQHIEAESIGGLEIDY